MKRTVFIIVLFLAIQMVQAQQTANLLKGKSSLVYSLPKTEILVDIEIEKTVQKPGKYYQYSERYLATNQIIKEKKVSYQIKSINIRTASLPDLQRTYVLPASKHDVLKQLLVNSKGLLCGINTKLIEKKATNNKATVFQTKSFENTKLLPLGEEYLMAGSSSKLAEGAAKQIYRIRESRMSLLTGDLENLPADGASLKTMLRELTVMENQLTALFVGTTETNTSSHTVKLLPTERKNKMILFRFSALKGLVNGNDLSGVPYFIAMNYNEIKSTRPSSKAKMGKTVLNTILPALTRIEIKDGLNNTFVSEDVLMPQFGTVVALGEDVFKNPNISVSVDPNTGRLLQVKGD